MFSFHKIFKQLVGVCRWLHKYASIAFGAFGNTHCHGKSDMKTTDSEHNAEKNKMN